MRDPEHRRAACAMNAPILFLRLLAVMSFLAIASLPVHAAESAPATNTAALPRTAANG
jgi:hypothetical protein